MADKTCSKCKENKDIEDFARKYKDRDDLRNSWCRSCNGKSEAKKYREDEGTRERIRRNNQKSRKRNRQFLLDYYTQHPCALCGESDYRCLQFDHLDKETKEYNVSHLISYSLDKLKKEIEKCRVLCANCHMRHTAEQFGWYKSLEE